MKKISDARQRIRKLLDTRLSPNTFAALMLVMVVVCVYVLFPVRS